MPALQREQSPSSESSYETPDMAVVEKTDSLPPIDVGLILATGPWWVFLLFNTWGIVVSFGVFQVFDLLS